MDYRFSDMAQGSLAHAFGASLHPTLLAIKLINSTLFAAAGNNKLELIIH